MIQTVLLDLGGVLIDVDYHASVRAFAAMGVNDFDTLYSKAKQSDLFDRFEVGALSPAEFRDELRRLTGTTLSDARIDSGWHAMLGSVPPARIELLHKLKERYTLLLLSNTNALHVPEVHAILARENGISDFDALFHGAYYSSALGMRKPHPETFLQVLAKHGADPATTLFVDDSIQHVEGARQAGLQAEHLDLAKEDVLDLVERLRLLA